MFYLNLFGNPNFNDLPFLSQISNENKLRPSLEIFTNIYSKKQKNQIDIKPF
jgi:hypothetical protein